MKVTLETHTKKIQNYFHTFFDIESGNQYNISLTPLLFIIIFTFFFSAIIIFTLIYH